MQGVGILYSNLVYFVAIRYAFPRFGLLHPEKSGNPVTSIIRMCPELIRRKI
jgi:hypothetical protein